MNEAPKEAQERVDKYNKHLKEKYGEKNGKPNYRVIWSSGEYEYRRGTFGQFAGEILIAEDRDVVKYVQKYNYCLDRWILEKLEECDNMPVDLVSLTNVSYEPLYVFWLGEEGIYEEPTLDQIERRVFFDINKTLRGHTPTEAKLRQMELEKRVKNRAKLRDMIDNELPDLPHAMMKGSAVFVDARKKKIDASSST